MVQAMKSRKELVDLFGTRVGTSELLLIFALVLIVFGPQRLPEIGRALGRGLRDFKSAMAETFEKTEEKP